MKVGDKVRSKGHFAGIEGRVTQVDVGVSTEDHGGIEIRVTKVNSKKYNWLKVGDLEHFVHYDWQDSLEIIDDA